MIYAGFWKRFLAVSIDACILIIPSLLIAWAVPFVGALVLSFLYYPVFNSSFLMATPGKAMMGLAVTDENGNRLSFKSALIRIACSFFSAAFAGIGYFISLFTAKRQTFHDMVSGSVVILKTPTDVNYFQVWFAEIKKIAGDDTATDEILKTTTDSNAAKAIEDLYKLFQTGAITQSEFETKKTELLKKI